MAIYSKFACVALLSCVSLPVLAADADLKLKAPAKIPPISWSGAYVGVHAGGQYVASSINSTNALGQSFSNSSSTTNFLGGALAGYNWEIRRWVLGLEGDWSIVDNGSGFHPNLFTLRGRAGFTYDNVLFYTTAGGGTRNSFFSRGFIVNGAPPQFQRSFLQLMGPVAGGGVEMKLPYHLSARAEGLYYYEKGAYNFSPFPLGGFTLPAATWNQTLQHFIYRASLIYNFN